VEQRALKSVGVLGIALSLIFVASAPLASADTPTSQSKSPTSAQTSDTKKPSASNKVIPTSKTAPKKSATVTPPAKSKISSGKTKSAPLLKKSKPVVKLKRSSTTKKATTKKATTKRATSKKSIVAKSKKTAARSSVHKYRPPVKRVVKPLVTKKKAPVKWPPNGFSNLQSDGTVPTAFGKYATLTEIKNESTNSQVVKQVLVNSCTKFACRGVYVTAINSCSWWQIDSDVLGVDPNNSTQLAKLGSLTTYAPATNAKQVRFNLLISKVPATPGTTITNVSASCMSGTPAAKVPSNIYHAVPVNPDTSTSTPPPSSAPLETTTTLPTEKN
jgi:hypothetical protein